MELKPLFIKDDDINDGNPIIYLVDPSEQIVIGNNIVVDGLLGRVTEKFSETLFEVDLGWSSTQTKTDCQKVLASSNKLDKLPQLSEKSIKLLNDYYTIKGKMPNSVTRTLEKCRICNGDGECQVTDIDYDTCRVCNGKGKIFTFMDENGNVIIKIVDSDNNIKNDILHVCNWYQGRDVDRCERVEKLAENGLFTQDDIYNIMNEYALDVTRNYNAQITNISTNMWLANWFKSKK